MWNDEMHEVECILVEVTTSVVVDKWKVYEDDKL